MNIFIMLATLLANAIAILLVYQFVKKLTKMDKIVFITAVFAVSYICVSIIYWISGFGIDNEINEAAKSFVTYVFVPVNVILFAPFVGTKYNKFRAKEIQSKELIKRLIVVAIVAIIVLTCECFYFKGIKQNIAQMKENAQLIDSNEKENSNGDKTSKNVIDTNEINENIVNVQVVNETTNNILVNEEENITNKNYLE